MKQAAGSLQSKEFWVCLKHQSMRSSGVKRISSESEFQERDRIGNLRGTGNLIKKGICEVLLNDNRDYTSSQWQAHTNTCSSLNRMLTPEMIVLDIWICFFLKSSQIYEKRHPYGNCNDNDTEEQFYSIWWTINHWQQIKNHYHLKGKRIWKAKLQGTRNTEINKPIPIKIINNTVVECTFRHLPFICMFV